MFKKKPRSKSSFLIFNSSNRGSDIVKPNNTSLIVNESDTETDELPRELTSILSEDEDDSIAETPRKTTSFMRSLSQKTQSTPRNQLSGSNGVLKEINQNANNKGRVTLSGGKNGLDAKKVSYFDKVLKECGASQLPGNSSYLMSEDQAVFSMKLDTKLKENNKNLKEFLESLEKEIENSEILQKMLAHTLTAEDCEVARGPVQEPLMRMLLNVECLQPSLIKLLLKKLATIIIDSKMESEDCQIVSSILRQFRFLNKVKDVTIASKLLEIINVASLDVQREIIFLLPEIITEEETEETSTQLVDLLKYDAKLSHVIVDALTNLPLSKTERSQIRTKMLIRLDKCPLEFLPSQVQFILNKCDAEELTEVINSLRENLPFTLQHLLTKDTSNKEEDSFVKLTFENLKFSVMASKQMTDVWIKVISGIDSSSDFRPVDLMMMIIFYSCLSGRKGQILMLLRNKIKCRVLTEVHVQNTFKILSVVTVEYFSEILELASIFLKSFEQIIADFGAGLYKESFIRFHFYMEQTVMNEILLHVGTGSPATVNTALFILKSLSESKKEALSRHTTTIMGLLIKVSDLDLAQVRLLLDVIADLIFLESAENEGWQDELQIFIRKQLASSKLEQCKKGIVAAIVFAKHAGKPGEREAVNAAQINSLLEMALGSNGTCETKRGFFNDEFATMIRESQLTTALLDTWKDKTFRMVLTDLFVKNIDIECEHFPMSLQHSLDSVDERKFVFPVVDFIIKSHSAKPLNIPVSVIPSTLRLLWCCEPNSKKTLSVFCASVIMPELTVFDKFTTFDTNQKKMIMDCLFLCANYLTECVNAFCTQKMFDKGLLRIKQLVNVRKLILAHIHMIPDYVPPLCQFYAPLQKIVPRRKNTESRPKKGRKRKIDDGGIVPSNRLPGESQMPADTSTSFVVEATGVKERSGEDNLHAYRGYFRELHSLTHSLLKMDLKMAQPVNDENWSCQNVEKPELNTSDVLFLLEDFIEKSERVLKEAKRFNFKSKPSATVIEDVTAEEFVAGAVNILPQIMRIIEMFSSYCKNLLKANDWIYDGPGMHPMAASDVKLGLAAALKFVAEIVSWRGFENPNNKTMLRDVLTILARKDKFGEVRSIATPVGIGAIALEAANHISGFRKSVLVLAGGLSMLKACQACLQYSSSKPSNALAELSHDLLSRPWFTVNGAPERGSVYNHHVDSLLKTYFANVDNKLQVVRSFGKVALEEARLLVNKDSVMKGMPTINKMNFPLLYRAMCEALVSASNEEFSKITNDDQLSLEIWSVVVETLLLLVEIVKVQSSRINLASLLKRSQAIVQLFLSKGMPIVESALRVKSEQVLKLLKSLQTVTRFLHSICCQSKVTSDSIVAAHVPTIRSQCERLTLEVKGMLIMNEIPMECITIAILKNKDIKGNDIMSQESVEDESDDDSELPPEDTPDRDEDIEVDAIEATQESNSEAY